MFVNVNLAMFLKFRHFEPRVFKLVFLKKNVYCIDCSFARKKTFKVGTSKTLQKCFGVIPNFSSGEKSFSEKNWENKKYIFDSSMQYLQLKKAKGSFKMDVLFGLIK